MKFLFVIGVEKCGTTSLFEVMRQLDIYNMSTRKETFFFSRHYAEGFDKYYDMFENHPEQIDRFNVDITPSYFRKNETIERIKNFEAEKKIVICFRNPITRAYSHYLHDLRLHFTSGKRSDNFKKLSNVSFSEFFKNKNSVYFTRYNKVVEMAFNTFSRKNCEILIFEEMVSNWSNEISKLDRLLGNEVHNKLLQNANFPHLNKTENIPYIFSHWHENDHSINMAQQTENGVRIFQNLSSDQFKNAMSLQNSIDLSVDTEILNNICEWFAEDITDLENLIDRDLRCWQNPETLKCNFFTPESTDMKYIIDSLAHSRKKGPPDNNNVYTINGGKHKSIISSLLNK